MSAPTKTTAVRGWKVRCWRIEVLSGTCAGTTRTLEDGIVRIGSGAAAELRVDDATVSRIHLQCEVALGSIRVTDPGSKNGTYFQGSRIEALQLPPTGAVMTLGNVEVGFFPADEVRPIAPATTTRCGELVGQSEVMRSLFAQIERVARADVTVLVHGETGTGKELVAAAIHDLSPRAERPFVIVDCGAIPRELIESELFGHARGAFTGAVTDFRGSFERASGGTLFLDEIGELPLDLQPKLLRALETGVVRPVGKERSFDVDVRVVAASLRDLADEVAAGRFREDLYFRLAVVQLEVPPLRERLDDLALLIDALAADDARPLDAESLVRMGRYGWPGNVRELRNVLARARALTPGPVLRVPDDDLRGRDRDPGHVPLAGLPYKDAKDLMVTRFTRDYLETLLRRHDGNVSAAAREAQIDRNWLVALARRSGVNVRG